MKTPSDITALLKAWGINEMTSNDAIQDNIQLISLAGGKQVVLKDVGADTETVIKRLEFERDVLEHVAQQGLAVAIPLSTQAGKPFHVASGRVYRLSHWLPNKYVEPRTDDERAQLYRNYGAAIARFHLALARYQDTDILTRTWQTGLRSAVLDEAVPAVLAHLDQALLPAFTAAISEIKQDMALAFEGLPEQPIIWDCHPGNVAVNGFEVTGFIDCDHIAIAPRIHDLADFLVHLIKWGIGNEKAEQTWIAFFPEVLRGYESISLLSTQERNALYFAMVGIPLIFMEFFYKVNHKKIEPIRLELRLFHWLVQHRNEIQSGI